MPKKTSKKTKTDSTLVTFLLDRTGSMQSIKDDTIGAFNSYLETLQNDKDVDIEFTFIQFDSISLDKVCVATPVSKVEKLNDKTFEPRAWTPLIDAAYKTIKAVDEQIKGRKTAPKVVICIQTDGQENASKEHTWEDLNALIKEKTALGWQFNFMGAGIDAYEQGKRMGISRGSTVAYSNDSASTRAAFAATACNTASFLKGQALNTAFSMGQKMSAGDKFDPTLKQGSDDKKKIVDDLVL